MAYQELSKGEIMRELDAITHDLAQLIKAANSPYDPSLWAKGYFQKIDELKKRLYALRIPIHKLSRDVERVEAIAEASVLSKLIG